MKLVARVITLLLGISMLPAALADDAPTPDTTASTAFKDEFIQRLFRAAQANEATAATLAMGGNTAADSTPNEAKWFYGVGVCLSNGTTAKDYMLKFRTEFQKKVMAVAQASAADHDEAVNNLTSYLNDGMDYGRSFDSKYGPKMLAVAQASCSPAMVQKFFDETAASEALEAKNHTDSYLADMLAECSASQVENIRIMQALKEDVPNTYFRDVAFYMDLASTYSSDDQAQQLVESHKSQLSNKYDNISMEHGDSFDSDMKSFRAGVEGQIRRCVQYTNAHKPEILARFHAYLAAHPVAEK